MDKRFPQYEELDLLVHAGLQTLGYEHNAQVNWYHL